MKGNISFTPLGNFSVCKTISEIKQPHPSIIIIGKTKSFSPLTQENNKKISIHNVPSLTVSQSPFRFHQPCNHHPKPKPLIKGVRLNYYFLNSNVNSHIIP